MTASVGRSAGEAGRRRRDLFCLLPVLAGALALGAYYILLRHPAYFDIEWVLFERGNQLFRARHLADGATLYRDVAFQYGPIAAVLHAAWCKVAGVGISQTLVWHLFWSLLDLTLGYFVFRRMVSPVQAALYTALLWIPTMLEPGGLVRSINGEHQTMDRAYLLAILLLWNPPSAQTLRRAAGIGLAMGAWQCTKFGGAIYAGVAMALVDVAWLVTARAATREWKRWFGQVAVIVAVVLVCEGILVAWCLTWGDFSDAMDVVWPRYMLHAYDVLPTPAWPRWRGVRFLVQFQFLPLLALAVGVAAWFRSGTRRLADHSVAWIAAGFYLLGIGTYIRISWNFYLYSFALMPLLVSGLATLRADRRRLLTMSLLIPFAIVLRSALTPWAAPPGQPPPNRPFVLPDGETLFLSAANVERMQRLDAVVREVHARPGRPLVLGWLCQGWGGGGFLHFYEPRYPLRNFFASSAAMRPWDVEQLRRVLPDVGALVFIVLEHGPVSGRDELTRLLPADLVQSITDRFERVEDASGFWIAVWMPKER